MVCAVSFFCTFLCTHWLCVVRLVYYLMLTFYSETDIRPVHMLCLSTTFLKLNNNVVEDFYKKIFERAIVCEIYY